MAGDGKAAGATTVLEVYADIWCPFAHVGLRCVVARRAQWQWDVVVLDVRAWPLELVNGRPMDPVVTARHVEELRSQVAPDLFGGFDPAHFPTTTLPALALVHAAYRQDLRAGEAMSLAVRDALFEEGRDISRPEVLADLAGPWGVGVPDPVDERGVLAQWHEGERRGVRGSPHFFCGGTDIFCPSLDISRRGDGTLNVRNSTAVLDGFLSNCVMPRRPGAAPPRTAA